MIKIVAVGKIKEKAYKDIIEEYLKRLKPYSKIEIIEVNDEVCNASNSEGDNIIVKKKEGERILSKIKDNDYVVLLDLWGEQVDSIKLANKINNIYTYNNSNITFVIAGSLGYSDEVISRANYKFKLSDLTFTHQMVRVLLIEQIYRCYKILGNEIYHK